MRWIERNVNRFNEIVWPNNSWCHSEETRVDIEAFLHCLRRGPQIQVPRGHEHCAAGLRKWELHVAEILASSILDAQRILINAMKTMWSPKSEIFMRAYRKSERQWNLMSLGDVWEHFCPQVSQQKAPSNIHWLTVPDLPFLQSTEIGSIFRGWLWLWLAAAARAGTSQYRKRESCSREVNGQGAGHRTIWTTGWPWRGPT